MNGSQFGGGISVPSVVKNLLIINVLFFIGKLVLESKGIDLTRLFGVYYFDSERFHPWQIVTHLFMHGGWEHLFFNMFALFMFGSVLENIWGPQRFAIYYFLCGFGALALQMIASAGELYLLTGRATLPPGYEVQGTELAEKIGQIYASPMVGASGAIFGLLMAFAMLMPNAELFLFFIPVPIKAKYFVTLYILYELFLGVRQYAGDSIAHFAHLGGAFMGFILIRTWNNNRFKRL